MSLHLLAVAAELSINDIKLAIYSARVAVKTGLGVSTVCSCATESKRYIGPGVEMSSIGVACHISVSD